MFLPKNQSWTYLQVDSKILKTKSANKIAMLDNI